MASTDTRTGFRLPWVSDAHHADDPAAESDPAAERSPDEASDDAATASSESAADHTAPPAEAAAAETAALATAPTGPMPARAAAAPTPVRPTRRPTKFLADLARAMHAAAETERQEILERFQADAKAFIEAIHEGSAVEATDLRAAADADIAAIRDWSKAEIARIREETESRISSRRHQLEGEVEDHAARIERRIERLRATVGEFETEMSRFFEALLAEEDPTEFAVLASNLPEPPSLEAVAAAATEVVQPEAAADTSPAELEDSGAEAPEDSGAEAPETPEQPGIAAVAEQDLVGPEADVPVTTADPDGADVEMTKDANAAEATAVEATVAETSEPVAAPDAESIAPADAEPVAAPSRTASGAPAWPSGQDEELSLDPRVAALGLTPDFDAAEAEAAAAVEAELPDDGSGDDVPALDDETIASRLAGLVPPAGAATDSVVTSVFAAGLVSVASIAGFKRGLARIEGVQGVSVSSGPDGEFVFSVDHAPGLDLGGGIATMQGFGARVVASSDGRLDVTAHDPDAA